MTQRGTYVASRQSKKQHFWADIERNWEQYRLYAQYRGLQCPKCNRKDSFAFHAYYRGRKRYKCKCGATINELSQSLLHRSRHPDKWPDFIEMVVKGASLGQMSEKLEVSKVTIYRWRKKFMQLATDFYQQRLRGIIQAEEVELTSQDRPKFIRSLGKKSKVNEQIYLIVAKDRLDNFHFQIKLSRPDLWEAFLNQVDDKSTIHANVSMSDLPNNMVPQAIHLFGPLEGYKTVEKRGWDRPASQFLRHFTKVSLNYRGLSINYLIGFLSLFALQYKLKKMSKDQQGKFFRYTLLTNNMRAANDLVFN